MSTVLAVIRDAERVDGCNDLIIGQALAFMTSIRVVLKVVLGFKFRTFFLKMEYLPSHGSLLFCLQHLI